MTTTSRTVSIIATVLGAVVLLGLVVSSARPVVDSVLAGGPGDASQSSSVEGITKIRVDSANAHVEIAFAEVPEAQLNVTSGSGNRWRLRTSGDTLTATNSRLFGGSCFIWCTREERVTILLPEELQGRLAADVELASGQVVVDGDFTDLGLEVAAGSFTFSGHSDTLDVDLAAGTAEITLRGAPPERVAATLAAGRLDLTVPDVPYHVRSDVTFGNVDNQLRTSPDSAHRIDVELAAGRATLRPGD